MRYFICSGQEEDEDFATGASSHRTSRHLGWSCAQAMPAQATRSTTRRPSYGLRARGPRQRA